MKLWEMSVFGGILILVILIVRRLFQDKVPQRTFLVLWMVALVRLLVPVSVAAPWSVYPLLEDVGITTPIGQFVELMQPTEYRELVQESARNEENDRGQMVPVIWERVKLHGSISVWTAVYFGGMLLCAGFYLFTYLKCYRVFWIALPVEDSGIQEWVASFGMKRQVQVRQSSLVSTPMTYGILHPVILLPKGIQWENPQQIRFALTHEMVHIQRFDVAKKMLFVIAVCIHWCNPLVWVMNVLANRDIELACDERVLQYFGREARADYALSLISLAERNSKFSSFPSCRLAGRMDIHIMEERIVAIMKKKKPTIGAMARAGILVAFVIVLFAASALQKDTGEDYVVMAKDEASAGTEVVKSDKVADLREISDSSGFILLPVPKSDPSEISSREGLDSEAVYEGEGEEPWLLQLYQNIYHSEEFPEYEEFGLSYDEENGYFMYRGEIVGYFKDEMEPGLFRMFTEEEGTIGLVVLRDSSWNMEGFQEEEIKKR